MELVYKPQDLIIGQMNNTLNKVDNCKVVKPTWKEQNTYGDIFFIDKRDGINESTANKPEGNIVDKQTIDGVDYILLHSLSNVRLAYFDGLNYTQIGSTYTKTDDTPINLLKGKTGAGEIFKSITIGDAYRDIYDEGIRNSTTSYLKGDVVSEVGVYYIALVDNTNLQPAVNPETWQAYAAEEYGSENVDPTLITYNDIYKGSYYKVKLEKSNIRDIAISGNYIQFYQDSSNLQGIATEIYYTETTYIDKSGAEVALPNDEVYVYIRPTNMHATKPYIGEIVYITTKVREQPIVAINNQIISFNIEKLGETITGSTEIVLYQAKSGDYIKDLCKYNGVIFILTNEEIAFTRTLPFSHVNFYPADSFEGIKLDRIIGFGKMLVGLGEQNIVITKVLTERTTDTGDKYTELSYIKTDLSYVSKLYSKYSVISVLSSLYILQDDKQFMQVDITSENDTDYTVVTKNAITNTKGLFEYIQGDIYINNYKKDIYVLDISPAGTKYYRYDIEYKQWDIGDYIESIYKIEDKLYGETIYEYNDNQFDGVDNYRQQVVGFDFGGDNIHTIKTVYMVKLIFGLNAEILDYTLEVDYELGGILHTVVFDLKNYPINMEIGSEGSSGLGDSNLGTTLLGLGVPETTTTIGNFVSVTVGLGISGSVFNFRIKSKDNGFIYGGSIVGYISNTPTVTEFNYKH